MELEEAKTILNKMKRTLDIKAPNVNTRNNDLLKFQAIETLLQALDNSIPKEKVKKVFETKIYNTKYLAKTDWTDYQREVDYRVASVLEVIKQELLEE